MMTETQIEKIQAENFLKEAYGNRYAKQFVNNLPPECITMLLRFREPNFLKKVIKLRWLILIASLPSDDIKITALINVIENISKNPKGYKYRHVKRLCEELKSQKVVIKPDCVLKSRAEKRKLTKKYLEYIAQIYGVENIIFFRDKKLKLINLMTRLTLKDEKAAKMFYILNFKDLLPLLNLTIESVMHMDKLTLYDRCEEARKELIKKINFKGGKNGKIPRRTNSFFESRNS